MATETYPLAMPADLLEAIRQTALDTGLSMADTMRQSMKLGLPRLKEQLSAEPRPEGYFAADYEDYPEERIALERASLQTPVPPRR